MQQVFFCHSFQLTCWCITRFEMHQDCLWAEYLQQSERSVIVSALRLWLNCEVCLSVFWFLGLWIHSLYFVRLVRLLLYSFSFFSLYFTFFLLLSTGISFEWYFFLTYHQFSSLYAVLGCCSMGCSFIPSVINLSVRCLITTLSLMSAQWRRLIIWFSWTFF
jgi:hypothetical protein